MNNQLGLNIKALRKKLHLTQEQFADKIGVSSQAVSKWENNLSCPDISVLPKLSEILGITVDELLSGKKEPETRFVPEEQRKDLNEMILRIFVDSHEGDKVRVNLPCALIKLAIECGMDFPQISGNDSLNSAMKSVDFTKIFEMIEKGAMGNLVEVESADGDIVNIFVE